MIDQFNFDTTLQLVASDKDEQDLQLIHRFADPSSVLDDFAILEMIAINDRPVVKDGLRLIISREFQQKHVDDMVSLPLVSDHRSERGDKLGRIFRSELVTEGDTTSIRVRAFIPKLPDNINDIERVAL